MFLTKRLQSRMNDRIVLALLGSGQSNLKAHGWSSDKEMEDAAAAQAEATAAVVTQDTRTSGSGLSISHLSPLLLPHSSQWIVMTITCPRLSRFPICLLSWLHALSCLDLLGVGGKESQEGPTNELLPCITLFPFYRLFKDYSYERYLAIACLTIPKSVLLF